MKTANIKDDAKRAMGWFSSMGDDQLLSRDFSHDLNLPEEIKDRLELLDLKGIRLMSYLDLRYWLPDNLLERADRLTMANSIELRAPFLDQNFMEFCLMIPDQLKIGWFSTKKLFREVMSEVLPREIVARRKMGFPTPIGYWLRNELRDWADSIIFSSCCKSRGLFDQKTLRTIFDDHVAGKRDNSKAIWTVINLELWFHIFIDKHYVKSLRT